MRQNANNNFLSVYDEGVDAQALLYAATHAPVMYSDDPADNGEQVRICHHDVYKQPKNPEDDNDNFNGSKEGDGGENWWDAESQQSEYANQQASGNDPPSSLLDFDQLSMFAVDSMHAPQDKIAALAHQPDRPVTSSTSLPYTF
jgi:hypothetical protein